MTLLVQFTLLVGLVSGLESLMHSQLLEESQQIEETSYAYYYAQSVWPDSKYFSGKVDDSGWREGQIYSTTGSIDEGFGQSVASNALLVAVGTSTAGPSSKVYLYERKQAFTDEEILVEKDNVTSTILLPSNSTVSWVSVITLTSPKLPGPPDPKGDGFGYSVSMSGLALAVGAPRDHQQGPSAGAVYLYSTADLSTDSSFFGASPPVTTLLQEGLAFTEGPESDGADSLFGSSIAVSDDTSANENSLTPPVTLIVGAPGARNVDGIVNAGTAYIYTGGGSNSEWSMDFELFAESGASEDGFGTSVALSGSSAMISAPRHNLTITTKHRHKRSTQTNSVGAVYFFERTFTKGNAEALAAFTTQLSSPTSSSSSATPSVSRASKLYFGSDRHRTSENRGIRGIPSRIELATAGNATHSNVTKFDDDNMTSFDNVTNTTIGSSDDYYDHHNNVDDVNVVDDVDVDDDDDDDDDSFDIALVQWTAIAVLQPEDLTSVVGYGQTIALSHSTALVGATSTVTGDGVVYVYVKSIGAAGSGSKKGGNGFPFVWTLSQILSPVTSSSTSATPFTNFGYALALFENSVTISSDDGAGDASATPTEGRRYLRKRAVNPTDDTGSSESIKTVLAFIGAPGSCSLQVADDANDDGGGGNEVAYYGAIHVYSTAVASKDESVYEDGFAINTDIEWTGIDVVHTNAWRNWWKYVNSTTMSKSVADTSSTTSNSRSSVSEIGLKPTEDNDKSTDGNLTYTYTVAPPMYSAYGSSISVQAMAAAYMTNNNSYVSASATLLVGAPLGPSPIQDAAGVIYTEEGDVDSFVSIAEEAPAPSGEGSGGGGSGGSGGGDSGGGGDGGGIGSAIDSLESDSASPSGLLTLMALAAIPALGITALAIYFVAFRKKKREKKGYENAGGEGTGEEDGSAAETDAVDDGGLEGGMALLAIGGAAIVGGAVLANKSSRTSSKDSRDSKRSRSSNVSKKRSSSRSSNRSLTAQELSDRGLMPEYSPMHQEEAEAGIASSYSTAAASTQAKIAAMMMGFTAAVSRSLSSPAVSSKESGGDGGGVFPEHDNNSQIGNDDGVAGAEGEAGSTFVAPTAAIMGGGLHSGRPPRKDKSGKTAGGTSSALEGGSSGTASNNGSIVSEKSTRSGASRHSKATSQSSVSSLLSRGKMVLTSNNSIVSRDGLLPPLSTSNAAAATTTTTTTPRTVSSDSAGTASSLSRSTY